MRKISNTKIIHHDGSVQWVMERTVGNTTYIQNEYFNLKQLPLRDLCAYQLQKARYELRVKTTVMKIWCEAPIPWVKSMREVAMRFGFHG